FFQAEDGIRDFHVTGVQTCLFRSEHDTRGRAWYRACRRSQARAGASAVRLLVARWHLERRTIDWARVHGNELGAHAHERHEIAEIGRASCRERGESAVGRGACTRE